MFLSSGHAVCGLLICRDGNYSYFCNASNAKRLSPAGRRAESLGAGAANAKFCITSVLYGFYGESHYYGPYGERGTAAASLCKAGNLPPVGEVEIWKRVARDEE